MPTRDAYSSGHLVPSLWDLHMFYLLRPILFQNLSLLYRTTSMLFEYSSVLSRFCFIINIYPFANRSGASVVIFVDESALKHGRLVFLSIFVNISKRAPVGKKRSSVSHCVSWLWRRIFNRCTWSWPTTSGLSLGSKIECHWEKEGIRSLARTVKKIFPCCVWKSRLKNPTKFLQQGSPTVGQWRHSTASKNDCSRELEWDPTWHNIGKIVICSENQTYDLHVRPLSIWRTLNYLHLEFVKKDYKLVAVYLYIKRDSC